MATKRRDDEVDYTEVPQDDEKIVGGGDPQNAEIDLTESKLKYPDREHNRKLAEQHENDGLHTGLADQPVNEGGVPVPPRDESIDDVVREQLNEDR